MKNLKCTSNMNDYNNATNLLANISKLVVFMLRLDTKIQTINYNFYQDITLNSKNSEFKDITIDICKNYGTHIMDYNVCINTINNNIKDLYISINELFESEHIKTIQDPSIQSFYTPLSYNPPPRLTSQTGGFKTNETNQKLL